MGTACGPAQTVGATEYGGPGDPSSGTVGASGVSLLAQPDSFAELGGTSFATATALGGLPYGTAAQITPAGARWSPTRRTSASAAVRSTAARA